jgi:hypothetical protein
MDVPFPKFKFHYVYDSPWPTVKVDIGHWPNFALYMITQLIMKIGSSNFAWRFSTKWQSFSNVYSWPWPTFRVIIGHRLNFALCIISREIRMLGSSNFSWMFPIPKQIYKYVYGWPWPIFRVNISTFNNNIRNISLSYREYYFGISCNHKCS